MSAGGWCTIGVGFWLAIIPVSAQDVTSLSWRGITVGMSPSEAKAKLVEAGFTPQPVIWGGRQQEDWEGTIPAFQKEGHCTGKLGEECEEVFLTVVRQPGGREIVWIISAHTHLSAPTFVDRIVAPAFERYGQPTGTTWGNGHKRPDGSQEFQLWGAHWYPNGSKENGSIEISLSIFPWQPENPSDPEPALPSKNARSWGVDVTVADIRILQRTQEAYDEQERRKPPPIRY